MRTQFNPEKDSDITTVIGVKSGKDLVPFKIKNAAFKSLKQIKEDMAPVVDLARQEKYKAYTDKVKPNQSLPTL